MDKIIMYIIGSFFVIGGIDYIFGSHFKLGLKFEEGIKSMGTLAIGMVGIYSLAPVLSRFVQAFISPIASALNIDPSIFSSVIFSVDMGGYQMAIKLAGSREMGLFSGVIIASTLGAVISFTIPVAMSMTSSEDEKYLSSGIMIGVISIPLGCFAAGLWQGISAGKLIWNLVPIVLFSMLLCIGLIKAPELLMRIFSVFGKFITAISIVGLILQGVYTLFGIKVFSNMASFSEAIYIVGRTAIFLGGAYTMLSIVNCVLKKFFERVGNKLGINSSSVTGILGALATNLLIFGTYKEMNSRGKIVCATISVSGAFVFGGELGFISGVAPKMITAFIIAKFTSAVASVFLALAYMKQKKLSENKQRGKLVHA